MPSELPKIIIFSDSHLHLFWVRCCGRYSQTEAVDLLSSERQLQPTVTRFLGIIADGKTGTTERF